MSKLIISETQKKAIRSTALAELNRMEQQLRNETAMDTVNKFKNKFILCEGTYKAILRRYLSHKKKQTSVLKLNLSQIIAALKFAGYGFDGDLLRRLFQSSPVSGRKTAKQLRNEVSHDHSQSAIDEILRRATELNADMDAFLDCVRYFDAPTNREGAAAEQGEKDASL